MTAFAAHFRSKEIRPVIKCERLARRYLSFSEDTNCFNAIDVAGHCIAIWITGVVNETHVITVIGSVNVGSSWLEFVNIAFVSIFFIP